VFVDFELKMRFGLHIDSYPEAGGELVREGSLIPAAVVFLPLRKHYEIHHFVVAALKDSCASLLCHIRSTNSVFHFELWSLLLK